MLSNRNPNKVNSIRGDQMHGIQLNEKRTCAILLIVIFMFAGFIRIWNIDVPSLWVDEVNTVFAAKSIIETGNDTLPSGMEYGRAYLHSFVVSLFFRIFGVSEASARYPSVLFGLLSIWMAYLLGSKVFNRKIGLLSALMVAFSNFEVGWSRTARMYTMLQFFSLSIVFCFLKGFEKDKISIISKSRVYKSSSKIKHFLNHHGISSCWLVFSILLIAISAKYIHRLSSFLLAGLGMYILFMAVVALFSKKTNEGRVVNKYSVTFILGLIAGVFFLLAIPNIRGQIVNMLSYTPPWAAGTATAQNRFYFFEFLISPWRFPLAAFFFIGTVQLISRRKQLGWIPLFSFVIPIFLLSFVFTHRVPAYLFNVYPFFLLIGAFGFQNILDSESDILKTDLVFKKTWVKRGILSLFFFIFIISPWLRITLNIPFLEDGITNMAVTPEEFREASNYVKENRKEGDVILSSLPQVTYYYGVYSDYGLNWANLEQSREKQFRDKIGRWVDVYVGVKCVESLEELITIVDQNQRGWIIMSYYHLTNQTHIPNSVKEYIDNNFEKPKITKNGTVLIYNWSRVGEAPSEL
jgi:4-amino-4-deoxy-L-arabinose transferase-like glycosyltransferase